MTNKETRAIALDNDSDFLIDFGEMAIITSRTIANQPGAPLSIITDWKIIETWLNCSGREISIEDKKKIHGALKYYYARGVAPSETLQESFTSFAKQYQKDDIKKPPIQILDVFDRMFATNTDIKCKQEFDSKNSSNNIKYKNNPETKFNEILDYLKSLNRNKRAFISMTTLWFIWVLFRTINDYKIMGVRFDDWSEKMFLINLILPPIIIFGLFILYKWVKNADK